MKRNLEESLEELRQNADELLQVARDEEEPRDGCYSLDIESKYRQAAIAFERILEIDPNDISAIKKYKVCLERADIKDIETKYGIIAINALESELKKCYSYELYKAKCFFLSISTESYIDLVYNMQFKNHVFREPILKFLANKTSLLWFDPHAQDVYSDTKRANIDSAVINSLDKVLCQSVTVKFLDIKSVSKQNIESRIKNWKSLTTIFLRDSNEFLLNKSHVSKELFASTDNGLNDEQKSFLKKCELVKNLNSDNFSAKDIYNVSLLADLNFVAKLYSPYQLRANTESMMSCVCADNFYSGIANSPIGIAIPSEVMAYIMSFLSEKEKGQLLFVCKS